MKNKNLISISGRIGSGKDTVGKIIQYLIHTEGQVSMKYFKEFNENSDFSRYNFSGWEIKKFADKLKDIVCLLIGCTREDLEDSEIKSLSLQELADKDVISKEFVKLLDDD